MIPLGTDFAYVQLPNKRIRSHHIIGAKQLTSLPFDASTTVLGQLLNGKPGVRAFNTCCQFIDA